MRNTKAAAAYVNSKTAVWWDMDTCPVPDGYDARRVRPSIEWALKDLGYCGPITITAKGNLEKIPPHVLRGLSSTGILVQHTISDRVTYSIFEDLMKFKSDNPPPATIMLISDNLEPIFSSKFYLDQQIRRGYNLVLARTFKESSVPRLYHSADWVWKTLLAANSGSEIMNFDIRKWSASFCCISCDFTTSRVTDFTSHLSTEEHNKREIIITKYRIPHFCLPDEKQYMLKRNTQAATEYVNSITAVWWDMETCPLPDGYDAWQVRPSIESALMDLGYRGPLTITAKGNLEKTPPHVLQGLSSTGIIVQHYISSKISGSIFNNVMDFKFDNPPPATIMFISDTVEHDLSPFLCRQQQQYGRYYNYVMARTYTTWRMSDLYHTAEWLWGTLLKQERRKFVLQKGSESGDSASFSCISCRFTTFSVTDFTSHLSTEEHKQMEIRIIKSSMPESEEDIDFEEMVEEDMDFEEEMSDVEEDKQM